MRKREWNWRRLFMVHYAIPILDSAFSVVCLEAEVVTVDVVPSHVVYHMQY